jgi:hypothetical protein
MKPDTSRIIDSIIWSLEAYVVPETSSPFAASIMVTAQNLLRHVGLRARIEPELRWEDNADLESVLERVLHRLERHAQMAATLREALAATRKSMLDNRPDPVAFPSIDRLTARSLALRTTLDGLLKALIAVRDRYCAEQTYLDCRQEIRNYLARQLVREDQLITPAFIGNRR